MPVTYQQIQQRVTDAHAPGRWMAPFIADDMSQEIALAEWLYPTEHSRNVAIAYAMRRLRHELFDTVSRRPRTPALLKPSKAKWRTGYRRDSAVKAQAFENRKNGLIK